MQLAQAEFTYTSVAGSDTYTFTIVQNSAGKILVRDIQDPYGMVVSPYTQIPQSVTDDIASAMTQVEDILAVSSSINGTLTFAAETSKSVTFSEALSGTDYRVHLSSDLFTALRITSKTVSGFTVEAAAVVTGSVGYDVLL